MGVLAGVASCRRSWKWVMEEDQGWHLNTKGRPPCAMEKVRDLAGPCGGKKGWKRLSTAGHEEVPHGFGLRTGDLADTDDGVGNRGRPAQQGTDYGEEPGHVGCRLQFFSLFSSGRQYFWLACSETGLTRQRGEGRMVCLWVYLCFLKGVRFNGRILPLL